MTPSDHRPPGVDPAVFRRVLGHLPTGVTVVTACVDGRPVGMSTNSFTSVSLEPPLVSFAAGDRSETWPHIRRAGRFAANVLAFGHEALGRRFSQKGIDRFEGVDWHPSALGSPLLTEALAWLDCEIEVEHRAGDHVIVIGAVREMDARGEGHPLVFYRGAYGGLSVGGDSTA